MNSVPGNLGSSKPRGLIRLVRFLQSTIGTVAASRKLPIQSPVGVNEAYHCRTGTMASPKGGIFPGTAVRQWRLMCKDKARRLAGPGGGVVK